MRLGSEAFFFTDSRYKIEADSFVKGAKVIICRDLYKEALTVLKKSKIKKIIFDPKEWSIAGFEKLALNSKITFKKELRNVIRGQITCNIDNIEYGNPMIKKVLLLFNIETIIKNSSNERFPFSLLETQNWDIEHIRSQNDKNIIKEDRKDWATDMLEFFTERKEINEQKDFINSTIDNPHLVALLELVESPEINENKFAKIYIEVSKIFQESNDFVSKDSISNLALLDAETNRSYGNAFFSVKRRIITEKDMKGKFVPLCTKNVFLKSYSSRSVIDNLSWTQPDSEDYLEAIKDTLGEYCNDLKTENHE